MKKLFKWVFRLLIVLVILLVLLVAFIDPITKAGAERLIRSRTGLETHIGHVSVGLKNPTISLNDCRLLNPPELGGSPFLNVQEFFLEYDRSALASGKIHLTAVRLNVSELHVVQNREGRTSLDITRERRQQRETDKSPIQPRAEFQGIDALTLSLGRFKFTSNKNPTNNLEVWVGLKNETVKQVKSAEDLKPLFGRLALEKGIRFFSDYFNPHAPATPGAAAEPAVNDAGKPSDAAAAPAARP
jgi:uncharacterized protein involved in outer membrane biogenesis